MTKVMPQLFNSSKLLRANAVPMNILWPPILQTNVIDPTRQPTSSTLALAKTSFVHARTYSIVTRKALTSTVPYLTLPCRTLPCLTLPNLKYLTLPYLTLPYLTLPYLTLPYLT